MLLVLPLSQTELGNREPWEPLAPPEAGTDSGSAPSTGNRLRAALLDPPSPGLSALGHD